MRDGNERPLIKSRTSKPSNFRCMVNGDMVTVDLPKYSSLWVFGRNCVYRKGNCVAREFFV